MNELDLDAIERRWEGGYSPATEDLLGLVQEVRTLEAENAVLLQQFDAATQAYQIENERLRNELADWDERTDGFTREARAEEPDDIDANKPPMKLGNKVSEEPAPKYRDHVDRSGKVWKITREPK